MEDLCQIFPLVSQIVLNNLDDQSLANCKIANRGLKEFLEDEKLLSIRIIKKHEKNLELFSDSWKKTIHNAPREIVKELATAIKEFFKVRQSRYGKQWSPLHIAAERGLLILGQHITRRTEDNNPRIGDKNPMQTVGISALHMAAQEGHLEFCIFIMEKLENKNPGDNDGDTPLHLAARDGHLKVCRAIIETVENKNPEDNDGWTPLHSAAQEGLLEVCRAIMEELENKNPRDNFGRTPKNLARQRGHWMIVKLFPNAFVRFWNWCF